MSKRLALSVAVVTVAAAFIAACTGSSDDDDNNGQLINAGQGGASAGSAGSAGASSGSGGSLAGGGSGGGGATGLGTVGTACAETTDCAQGLECLSPSSTELGGSPPGGLCTVPCTGDPECTAVDPNAWCVGFTADVGYCVEGCLFDQGGVPKCHDRLDFLCAGVDSLATDIACTASADCGTNELCVSGICTAVLTVCLPACGSDVDCGDGQYCNFGTGLCEAAAPTGTGLHEACAPSADPDECVGFCRTSYDDPAVGSCSASCNLANPAACGYSGTGPANSACLLPSSLAGSDVEIGDVGSCAKLCDCNSDCTVAGEYCQPWDATLTADLTQLFQRDGYCFPIIPAADGGTFTVADSLDCGIGAGGAGPVPPAGGAGGAP